MIDDVSKFATGVYEDVDGMWTMCAGIVGIESCGRL